MTLTDKIKNVALRTIKNPIITIVGTLSLASMLNAYTFDLGIQALSQEGEATPQNGKVIIENVTQGFPAMEQPLDGIGYAQFLISKINSGTTINYDVKFTGNGLNFEIPGEKSLKVFDIKGAEVDKKDFNISQNESALNLNFNRLMTGTFFYQITDKNGNSYVVRTTQVAGDNGIGINKDGLDEIKLDVPVKNSESKELDKYLVTFVPDGISNYALTVDSMNLDPNVVNGTFVYKEFYVNKLSQEKNISGTIFNGHNYTIGGHADGEALSNVNVALVKNGSTIANITTGSDGKFEFLNVPTDKDSSVVYNIQVVDLDGDFRGNVNPIKVSPKLNYGDSIATNKFKGVAGYPGNINEFNYCMFEDPSEYLALEQGERTLSNPALITYPNEGMNRMIEGWAPAGSDGQVFVDWIMNRPVKIYGANANQQLYCKTFLTKLEGIADAELETEFAKRWNVVSTPTIESNPNTYTLWEGDVNAGINWGTDGNNTETYRFTINFDDGSSSAPVMGAYINSGDELKTWHEIMNIFSENGVSSEPSLTDAYASTATTNDILQYQYCTDAHKRIYQDFKHVGSLGNLRTNVLETKFDINFDNKYDFKK